VYVVFIIASVLLSLCIVTNKCQPLRYFITEWHVCSGNHCAIQNLTERKTLRSLCTATGRRQSVKTLLGGGSRIPKGISLP